MIERTDDAAVENFTAFVRSNLPPLPSFPETLEDGCAKVGVSSSTPAFAVSSSPLEGRRSPPPIRSMSNPRKNSATRRPLPDTPETLQNGAATTTSVAGAKSTASVTSTSFSLPAGPLPRIIANANTTVAQPSQLPLQSASPLSAPASRPPSNQDEQELPHLHDFLLHFSASSTVGHHPPHTQHLSAPLSNNYSPAIQSPNKLEEPHHSGPSSPSSRQVSPPQSSSGKAQRESPAQSSLQGQDLLDFPVPHRASGEAPDLPPRQMVRRSVASPLQHSPVLTAAAVVAVHESHGVLSADVKCTGGGGAVAGPGRSDTTRSFDAASPTTPTAPSVPPITNPRTPVDLSSPLYQRNGYADIDAAADAAAMASGLRLPDLPTRESFPVPRYCPDDLLRGEDKLWCPGKPLRIAYVTWNMANKEPRMDEVSAHCIHPNAHLVVVGTQENGPYIGTNKLQNKWARTIGDVCLGGQYELVGKHHMWAIQMLVFARKRDVAKYVSRPHASHVKTGLMNGLGGNKGGVAVGLVLSLTPKFNELSHGATTQRAVTTAPPSPRGERVRAPAGSINARPTIVSAANDGVHFPSVPRAEQAAASATTTESRSDDRGGENDAMDDDVPLSPSMMSGPPPPALLSAVVMQHDVDDDDANVYDRLMLAEISADTTGDFNDNSSVGAGLGDEAVFSPAEMVNRNASFDLSRSRQRGRRKKRHVHHRVGRKNRANGGLHNGNTRHHNEAEQRCDDDLSDGTPDGDTPNYMSLLFITAHLAAHQGAVVNRNKDYRQIVHGLRVGRRGSHRKFFKRLLRQRRVLGDVEGVVSDDDNDSQWNDDSSEEDIVLLSLPVVSAIVNRGKARRDVTEEFDLTFFGGDLNYRINGTRKAIEYVIQHHRNIRSILINNDQLSLERARGAVFQGYHEGNLLFRPTYKYEVSPSNGGVTLDEYNFSRKKDRMPAYCDRVLFKKKLSSAARRVAIRLYTDVPNVRTSDHRPVVALFDVGTRAYAA
ncbi:putative endonuclease/exonuclease/phosphatase [Leptomonas pyrrhocoris]|uniref:Putative endonuclease/exonuclease/phosphatase n=1 Tax=Leptomonas pyrrhocoris TaxID=157538 RepID=A0A0M9G121_LEPPY|nr:putative endonuclease/exonuclease/phosphatase [Leptomonas pyrrhocoris]KPA80007.1 putative endonuclease/exonuclease/phosphatase [Leptomonas pyrrhocoris]|eukprot:XP_015658446.1 putative endonuclease/exonuclease/phosphatase [Leptomonas pyrrhocoris]